LSSPGRVAIFGPGLIGGSVALALRARCPGTAITIWGRRAEQLAEILNRSIADAVETDPVAAVRNADLVILCTPIGVMKELAQKIAPHLAPDAVVTDAGSVKLSVVEQLNPILGRRFVGAHPMAGSERSGFQAARADLFDGAPCIVTPLAESDPPAVAKTTDFWKLLGCSVTAMPPREHDRLVARISHLPHALAFALVNLVLDTLPPGSQNLAGGSFRDGTRVAASDPALWTGILTENRTEVAAALREMAALLESMASSLAGEKSDSLLDFFTTAKHHRDSLPLPRAEENR
jgi:prephenate dehydrogenase